jgi:hypothetical protein
MILFVPFILPAAQLLGIHEIHLGIVIAKPRPQADKLREIKSDIACGEIPPRRDWMPDARCWIKMKKFL